MKDRHSFLGCVYFESAKKFVSQLKIKYWVWQKYLSSENQTSRTYSYSHDLAHIGLNSQDKVLTRTVGSHVVLHLHSPCLIQITTCQHRSQQSISSRYYIAGTIVAWGCNLTPLSQVITLLWVLLSFSESYFGDCRLSPFYLHLTWMLNV